MRRHRWPRPDAPEDERDRCLDCDVKRRFRNPPPGIPIPIIVEYLVSGVGWTEHRPECAIPVQRSLIELSDPPPALVVRHTCHAFACEVPILPHYFMCRAHWWALAPRFREEIWRTYRPGQELDKRPSDAYVTAAREAVAFIAQLEGRIPAP